MTFVATEGKENSDSKLYTAITPDKTLKHLMTPIYNFTQETDKALKGKQTTEELNEYKNYLINVDRNKNGGKPGYLIGIKGKLEQSNDPNKNVKIQRINELIQSIDSQNQAVVMGTNNDGDKIFISQPRFENGIPQNKVLVINTNDYSISDQPVDLGQVQNEESTNIQNKMAPAYNKSAQGYENKNIKYK